MTNQTNSAQPESWDSFAFVFIFLGILQKKGAMRCSQGMMPPRLVRGLCEMWSVRLPR